MADIKNFGIKGIGADVQFGKGGGSLSHDKTEFNLNGDQISGALLPVDDAHLASKAYVDSVAQGLDFKESCRAGSTENITLSGLQTLDSVTLVDGDRVLVKDQTDAIENGIYVAAAGAWSRSEDANAPSGELTAGSYVFVEEGGTQADTSWVVTSPDPIVVGTDPIEWAIFGRAGELVAGQGIDISGQLISTDFSDFVSVTATLAGTEEVALVGNEKVPLSKIIADLDLMSTAGVGNGVMVKIGDDQYASRSIVADAAVNRAGIAILNGDGVNDNPTVGLTIETLQAADEGILDSDQLVMWDGVKNARVGVDDLLSARGVVKLAGGTGFLHEEGGSVTNGSVIASENVAQAGIVVTGGTTAKPEIGLSLNGMSSIVGVDLEDSDQLWVSDGSVPQNKKITYGELKGDILGQVTANALTRDNSSLVLTDVDAGDASTQLELKLNSTSVATFGETGVTFAGTGSFAGAVDADSLVIDTSATVGTTLDVTGKTTVGSLNVVNLADTLVYADAAGDVKGAAVKIADTGDGVDLDFTAADGTIGASLNFGSLTGAGVADTHVVAVSDGTDHYTYTVAALKDFIQDSADEISADNSYVKVIDDGVATGEVDITVDGSKVVSVTAGGVDFTGDVTIDVVGAMLHTDDSGVVGATTYNAAIDSGVVLSFAGGVLSGKVDIANMPTGAATLDTIAMDDAGVAKQVSFDALLDDRNVAFDGDLDALEVRVTTLEGEMDAVELRLDTAEADIDALQATVAEHTVDLGVLEGMTATGAEGVAVAYTAADLATDTSATIAVSLDIDGLGENVGVLSTDDWIAVYDNASSTHVKATVQDIADIAAENAKPNAIISDDGDTVVTAQDGKSVTFAFDDLDDETLVTHTTVSASGILTDGEVDAGTLSVTGKAEVGGLEITGVADTLVWANADGDFEAASVSVAGNGVDVKFAAGTIEADLDFVGMTDGVVSETALIAIHDGVDHKSVSVSDLETHILDGFQTNQIDDGTEDNRMTVDGARLEFVTDGAEQAFITSGEFHVSTAKLFADVGLEVDGAATIAGGLTVEDTGLTVTLGGAAITGDSSVAGGLAVTGQVSGATLKGDGLTVDGGIAYSGTDGVLKEAAAFYFDDLEGELHAPTFVGDFQGNITTNVADTQVMFSNSGDIVGDAGMTYVAGSGLTLAAGVSAATVTATGAVTGDTGAFTTSLVAGTTTLGATGVSGGLVADTAKVTDLALGSGTHGVVYSDAADGELKTETGFYYDDSTDTLHVANISANIEGSDVSLTATEVAFGDALGKMTSEAEFSYDAANNTLSIGDFAFDGSTQTISGAVEDGDINIIPEGDGNVVIGAAGAGEIRSDAGQSMTVGAGTGGQLKLEGNDIIMGNTDGLTNYAQFTNEAGSDVHMLVTGGVGEFKIEDSAQSVGIIFDDGVLRIANATAAEYAAAVTDNDLVNKKYVDDAIKAAVTPGAVATVRGEAVSLGTTSVIGSLPAGATILSVRMNITASAVGGEDVKVTVGGVDVMTADENDSSDASMYMTDTYVVGAASDDIAVVGAATGGIADVIVEYRYN